MKERIESKGRTLMQIVSKLRPWDFRFWVLELGFGICYLSAGLCEEFFPWVYTDRSYLFPGGMHFFESFFVETFCAGK